MDHLTQGPNCVPYNITCLVVFVALLLLIRAVEIWCDKINKKNKPELKQQVFVKRALVHREDERPDVFSANKLLEKKGGVVTDRDFYIRLHNARLWN